MEDGVEEVEGYFVVLSLLLLKLIRRPGPEEIIRKAKFLIRQQQ